MCPLLNRVPSQRAALPPIEAVSSAGQRAEPHEHLRQEPLDPLSSQIDRHGKLRRIGERERRPPVIPTGLCLRIRTAILETQS